MIITKLALPRRTFLRGVGASLALPLLDAMVPALTAVAQTAARPVQRLGFVYIPNGAVLDHWTPLRTGTQFDLPAILSPLASLRDHLVVVSGLGLKAAEAMGDGGGDHSRAPAAWLNAVHPKKTEGADVRAGMTADQIAARALGQHTPLASLEVCLEPGDLAGSCGGAGYSCVYVNTISWRTETTPVPMENNPRIVFERLFGNGASVDERLAELRADRSLLDSVTAEIAALNRTLGSQDRDRVTEYVDAIRDIERRIQKAESRNATAVDLPLPSRPTGIPRDFEEHIKLMYDLQAIAFQADLTRVITFLTGRETSQRTHPQIGVPDPHHSTSHHQDDPQKIAKLVKINTYHVDLFRYFLERLRATPDGDGNLLDHSLILYGGGISDGNLHDHSPLPLVLAGGGAGRVKGGRHLAYPKDTPLANLLITLLDKSGVPPPDRIGDSTGPLDVDTLAGV